MHCVHIDRSSYLSHSLRLILKWETDWPSTSSNASSVSPPPRHQGLLASLFEGNISTSLANDGHEFEPIELHMSRQPKLLSSNQTPPPPAAFNWTFLRHAPPHLSYKYWTGSTPSETKITEQSLIAAVGLFQFHNSMAHTSLVYKTRSSHHPLHSTTLPTAVRCPQRFIPCCVELKGSTTPNHRHSSQY
jgi:hypothetical protein